MGRKKKRKQSMSYVPVLTAEDWLAAWSRRVGYVPPPAITRGQVLRKVTIENFGSVQADPTLFTPTGPSIKTQKRRHSRSVRGR